MYYIAVVLPYHEPMHKYVIGTIDALLSQEGVSVRLYLVHNGVKGEAHKAVARHIKNHEALDSGRHYAVHMHRDEPCPAGARNAALTFIAKTRTMSETEFDAIAFCDADDLWTPDHLFDACEELADTGADMYYCPAWGIDEDGNRLELTGVPRPEEFDARLLREQNYIYISSVVMRPNVAQSVGEFDPDMVPKEDWDYWIRVAKNHRIVQGVAGHVRYRWKSRGSYYSEDDSSGGTERVLAKHNQERAAEANSANLEGQEKETEEKISGGKTVVIAPYSVQLADGKRNPKNYPTENWEELVKMLRAEDIYTVQVGVAGEQMIGTDEAMFNLTNESLEDLVSSMDAFVSVDTFFQHLSTYHGKKGVVIFSQSDPKIFGHPSNVNLLKSREYLRANQYETWAQAEYNAEAFVPVNQVFTEVMKLLE